MVAMVVDSLETITILGKSWANLGKFLKMPQFPIVTGIGAQAAHQDPSTSAIAPLTQLIQESGALQRSYRSMVT